MSETGTMSVDNINDLPHSFDVTIDVENLESDKIYTIDLRVHEGGGEGIEGEAEEPVWTVIGTHDIPQNSPGTPGGDPETPSEYSHEFKIKLWENDPGHQADEKYRVMGALWKEGELDAVWSTEQTFNIP